jgi:hypothetical protein
MWVGYDVDGQIDDDDFINVDGWTDEQLAEYGVAAFKPVNAEELERWKASDAKQPRSRRN